MGDTTTAKESPPKDTSLVRLLKTNPPGLLKTNSASALQHRDGAVRPELEVGRRSLFLTR